MTCSDILIIGKIVRQGLHPKGGQVSCSGWVVVGMKESYDIPSNERVYSLTRIFFIWEYGWVKYGV